MVFQTSTLFAAFLLLYLLHRCAAIDLNIKDVGIIRGRTRILGGSIIDSFKGIPFAKAPIGKLRFAPPQPSAPWTGTRLPSQYIRCPQQDFFKKMFVGVEDCLYLNIFRGRNSSSKQMPVMVFIHGGSYLTGSGFDYSGEILASKHDVVVVTINYRLGILGFLSIPGSKISGNYGLMDQILAPQWVSSHISDFGGDPKKVTIFGESAGAASVTLLMLSPLAKGLFSRVISQSGSPLSSWAAYEKQNGSSAKAFASRLGCNDATKVMACLQGKTPLDILSKQVMLPNSDASLITPTVDGKVIMELPFKQSKEGRLPITNVDLLIGFSKDEGTMFVPKISWNKIAYEAVIKGALRWHYTDDVAMATELASFEYERFLKPANYSYSLSCNDFIADYHFKAGIINFATEWAKKHANTRVYHFTYLPKNVKYPKWGVAHAIELGFVFGKPLFPPGDPVRNEWLINNFTREDEVVSLRIMKLWTDFAKAGNPDSTWPTFDGKQKKYLEIDTNISVQQDYNPKKMTFWNSLVPKAIKMTKANAVPTRICSVASTNYVVKPVLAAMLFMLFHLK